MTDGFARHTPQLVGEKLVRAVSIDAALIGDVSDAITALTSVEQWVEVGDTVDAIVNECKDAVAFWYSDMLIGTVAQFMGSLPDGWLEMDGSTYDEVDYPELYAFLDTVFKNEIAETFTLPDIDGSVVVGIGTGVGLGDTGGASSVALSVAEMPVHNHSYVPPVLNIDLEGPGVPDILAAGVGAPTVTGDTGSGDSHENMPPYLGLRFGVFSGRV